MAAISRLGACGRPDAVTAPANAMTGGPPQQRARIAYALGRLGNPTAEPTCASA